MDVDRPRGVGLKAMSASTAHFNITTFAYCQLARPLPLFVLCALEGVASVAIPLSNDASECQFL